MKARRFWRIKIKAVPELTSQYPDLAPDELYWGTREIVGKEQAIVFPTSESANRFLEESRLGERYHCSVVMVGHREDVVKNFFVGDYPKTEYQAPEKVKS